MKTDFAEAVGVVLRMMFLRGVTRTRQMVNFVSVALHASRRRSGVKSPERSEPSRWTKMVRSRRRRVPGGGEGETGFGLAEGDAVEGRGAEAESGAEEARFPLEATEA